MNYIRQYKIFRLGGEIDNELKNEFIKLDEYFSNLSKVENAEIYTWTQCYNFYKGNVFIFSIIPSDFAISLKLETIEKHISHIIRKNDTIDFRYLILYIIGVNNNFNTNKYWLKYN